MIEFDCPECGEQIEIEQRMAGERVRCYGCDEWVDVPDYGLVRRSYPGTVMTAAILWLIYGGIKAFDTLYLFLSAAGLAPVADGLPAEPGAQAVVGVVGGLVSAGLACAFLVIGVMTIRGSATGTVGNGIGSIVIALVCVLPAAGRSFFQHNAVLALFTLLAGTGLTIAGILALLGQTAYSEWRDGGRRRRGGWRRRRTASRQEQPTALIVSLAVGIPLVLIVLIGIIVVARSGRDDAPVAQNAPPHQVPAPAPVPAQPPAPAPVAKFPPRPNHDGRWTVLFRSDDPSIWNTDVNDHTNRFARSLASVNAEHVRYLKITEAQGNQFVIMALSRDKLTATMDGARYGWEGTNHQNSGAFHLGIFDQQRPVKHGEVCIRILPWFAGWGFGHLHFVNNTQGYCWAGRNIPRTTFEIAVSPGPLTPAESASQLDK